MMPKFTKLLLGPQRNGKSAGLTARLARKNSQIPSSLNFQTVFLIVCHVIELLVLNAPA
jgi:hypothetical protein